MQEQMGKTLVLNFNGYQFIVVYFLEVLVSVAKIG
jgi:hypothetical protein